MLVYLYHFKHPYRQRCYGCRITRVMQTRLVVADVQPLLTPCATVERRDTTHATARWWNRLVVHSAKRMAMLRRRASGRRSRSKVEQVGRLLSFMVVMQLFLSLHTMILIIVCKCNSRGCEMGKRVRYL